MIYKSKEKKHHKIPYFGTSMHPTCNDVISFQSCNFYFWVLTINQILKSKIAQCWACCSFKLLIPRSTKQNGNDHISNDIDINHHVHTKKNYTRTHDHEQLINVLLILWFAHDTYNNFNFNNLWTLNNTTNIQKELMWWSLKFYVSTWTPFDVVERHTTYLPKDFAPCSSNLLLHF